MRKTQRKLKYVLLLCVLLLVGGTIFRLTVQSLCPLKYEKEILEASLAYNVEPFLISAVILAESRFEPEAVSKKGARGLMQLTEETYFYLLEKCPGGKDLPEDILHPRTNIFLGSYYLSDLLERFETLPEALAAYNAGPTKVRGWLSDPELSEDGKTLSKIPYEETRKYIQKVLKNLERYRRFYKEK